MRSISEYDIGNFYNDYNSYIDNSQKRKNDKNTEYNYDFPIYNETLNDLHNRIVYDYKDCNYDDEVEIDYVYSNKEYYDE